MGCCMSTNAGAPASGLKKRVVGSDEDSLEQVKGGFSHESRAPPPSVEEETVKEVLSETPKAKPKPTGQPPFTAEMKPYLLEEEEEEEDEEEEEETKILEKQNLGSGNEEIMSEQSEICSVSIGGESVSTMTNVTEEEQEVTRHPQRLMSSRSPAKPPAKVKRVMNQSPTRRSEQSPARRIGNGSAVKEAGRLKGGPGRRDPGECSRRRSRSPAAVTTRSSATMGHSPSARRTTNRSVGRVRPGPIENSNGTNINGSSSTMEGKWESNNNNNNNDSCSTNETLENPHVSLECFIFL